MNNQVRSIYRIFFLYPDAVFTCVDKNCYRLHINAPNSLFPIFEFFDLNEPWKKFLHRKIDVNEQ
jgi:hypothetical protein